MAEFAGERRKYIGELHARLQKSRSIGSDPSVGIGPHPARALRGFEHAFTTCHQRAPASCARAAPCSATRRPSLPRGDATTSGENFEILIGFDVTPQMAEFNRLGKRFRVNAVAPTAVAAAAPAPAPAPAAGTPAAQ